MTEQEKLWEFCRAYIAKQEISCPEAVYQCDRVILSAYEFIDGICEIVGYHDYGDDDE